MENTEKKEGLEGFEDEKPDSLEEENQDEGKILNTKLVALFIIGALVGITLKTHALQTLTMGFEDYKLQKFKSDFGLPAKIEEQGAPTEEELEPESGQTPDSGNENMPEENSQENMEKDAQ